jgi:hypothetical protein
MDRNIIKSRYRDQKLDRVLETPLTKLIKWFKIAWTKFILDWRVPQYTLGSILFINGIGLLWHITDYWLGYKPGIEKTCVGCFEYIVDTQLPWNITAFTILFRVVFWVVIICIPFVLGVALFSRSKNRKYEDED